MSRTINGRLGENILSFTCKYGVLLNVNNSTNFQFNKSHKNAIVLIDIPKSECIELKEAVFLQYLFLALNETTFDWNNYNFHKFFRSMIN